MSEPENVKEKALNVANEAAEKAKNLSQEGMKKADELYNKLPLDKLNEKFGGKIDFKSKKVKYGIFSAVGIVLLVLIATLLFGGNAPSSSEIDACKSRINRFEKTYGQGRKCKDIIDFEEVDKITPPRDVAKFLGLKREPCERFTCTIVWKNGRTSRGVFIRQDEKFGVFCLDWGK